jgi:Na+/melibiose symporter-like transporter
MMPTQPATEPHPSPGERLPRHVLVVYALPSVSIHFAMTLMGIYFFKYATDTLRVEPALMGFLFASARLWDGLSDPIAGYLSDRTRSRWGRRRSWLAVAVLPFGLSVLMLWSPPAWLAGPEVAIWLGVALLLFYTTYTALSVPYGALGAELSLDYHDRTRVFGYRQGIGALGLLCAVAAYYLLLEAERSPGSGPDARVLGLGVGLFTIVFGCGSIGLLLLVVQCLHFFSIASLSLGSAFLFQHVMDLPSYAAAMLIGCFATGIVLAIPLWVALSRRFGKHRCWRVALTVVGVLYLAVFFGMGADFADPRVLATSALFTVVLGGLQSSDFVLSHSLQADAIDFDEERTDQRKEGAYLATWSFAEKCSAALAAAAIGGILQWVEYAPGAVQSADTRLAILVLMSLVPSACHFAGALVLRGYALDEPEHGRIRAALASRGARGG